MIVSCAPLRVSFAGGGSDIHAYYGKSRGAVLSCAIGKYSFIIVHPFFNANKYHLKYTATELVDRVDEIRHPILREALRMQGLGPGLEIVSVADLPGGTGLGSSSSFSVALLNALYAHRGLAVAKDTLAREACHLEIDLLKEPIGKQDQYAAAYGGINFIEFESHGGVRVQPLVLAPATVAGLEDNLMLFYCGTQRDSRQILSHQTAALEAGGPAVLQTEKMVALAYRMRELLLAGDIDAFGAALDQGWELKRSISRQISNAAIDEMYARARESGALGGKLAGAGGGGFLLLYCPKPAQARVREALKAQQSVEFRFDWGGARIAFAQ